jgi:hypothetical protein
MMKPKVETTKPTNPKDAVGSLKAPASTVPGWVELMLGLGFLEGARKYGRHNYRIAGVRASVYYDAANRHLKAWWEGEDYDPDTALAAKEAKRLGFDKGFVGLPHPIKAMCCLVVLMDAKFNDVLTDDRPPPMKNPNWLRELNHAAAMIVARYPNSKQPYVKGDTKLHEDPPMFTPAKRVPRKTRRAVK